MHGEIRQVRFWVLRVWAFCKRLVRHNFLPSGFGLTLGCGLDAGEEDGR
jgi:hypothetical protein